MRRIFREGLLETAGKPILIPKLRINRVIPKKIMKHNRDALLK